MSIFIGNCYAVIPVMMSRRSIKNAVVPDKEFLIPVILAMMIRRFLLQLIAGEGEGVHGRWVAFGFKSDLIWFILATRFLHKERTRFTMGSVLQFKGYASSIGLDYL